MIAQENDMSAGTVHGARRNIPGNRIAAGAIWATGAVLTYAALGQISEFSPAQLFLVTLVLQFVLTKAQSPVWHGRGNLIGYTCLFVDTVFNFGGVMAFVANLDQMGSVQALGATFFSSSAAMPMPIKGVLALFFAAVIAGLPEYLWELD